MRFTRESDSKCRPEWWCVAGKAGLLVISLSASGCLMAFNGSTEPVALGSSPSGATAVVDGQQYATPTTVQLTRNQNHTIIFKKEGYEDASATLASATDPWLVGDVLLWGPLAFLDYANGSAYKLSEESVQVSMVEKPTMMPTMPATSAAKTTEPAVAAATTTSASPSTIVNAPEAHQPVIAEDHLK
jgi:hypothetical protein